MKFLTEKEATDFLLENFNLRISVPTLRKRRSKKLPPSFVPHGKRGILYTDESLLDYASDVKKGNINE